jgi:hypothetical protein
VPAHDGGDTEAFGLTQSYSQRSPWAKSPVQDDVHPVHGAGRERLALVPATSAKLAVAGVDVLGAKRLQPDVSEARHEVADDDAPYLSRRRGDQFGDVALYQVLEKLAHGRLRGHPTWIVDAGDELGELSLSGSACALCRRSHPPPFPGLGIGSGVRSQFPAGSSPAHRTWHGLLLVIARLKLAASRNCGDCPRGDSHSG